MLLVTYLRENFERLLLGDDVQEEREGTIRRKVSKQSKITALQEGKYESLCEEEPDVTSSESLSAGSLTSQDCHSSDDDCQSPRKSRKECSLMALDCEQSSAIASKRSKELPGTWYYSSNHIMINNERTKNNVHPLIRRSELDAVARWHAENMANADRVHHSNPQELKIKIGKSCRRLGENIARGENIRAIHNRMIETPCDLRNLIDSRYLQFGMGTARGPSGDLFLCQIFRG